MSAPAWRSTPGVRTATRAGTLVLLVALVTPLAALAHRAQRQASGNMTAMEDVMATARTLQGMPDGTVVHLTVTGPGRLPGLGGTPVSAGTMLFARRWPDGRVYVRGAHADGDAVYYFRDGELAVGPRPARSDPRGTHG